MGRSCGRLGFSLDSGNFMLCPLYNHRLLVSMPFLFNYEHYSGCRWSYCCLSRHLMLAVGFWAAFNGSNSFSHGKWCDHSHQYSQIHLACFVCFHLDCRVLVKTERLSSGKRRLLSGRQLQDSPREPLPESVPELSTGRAVLST